MHLASFRVALYTLFLVFTVFSKGVAQPDIARIMVSASQLRKHVFTIASDSLQGRATGTAGQLKAAFYCVKSFRQSHLFAAFRPDSLQASFRQTFPFTATEVVLFGSSRIYGSIPYKRHELLSAPLANQDSIRVLFGDNVAGLLIGTDLKQEVVVLSAHYDHLGQSDKRIFHGADDNASGTATVLSVASVFDSLAQQKIRPRRSILFVLFSGEEGGLLGSEYFIRNTPIPVKQLVGNLNVDMVGRVDHTHRKKPNYCYLITNKQGDKLQEIAEIANSQSIKMALNQEGYDTENDPEQHFYRSDQYSFAKRGIPALLFTSGNHPDYHQPSDTANKIAYDVLQKRATLIFQTAWRLANPLP